MDIFEILSVNKSLMDVDISPHYIDIDNGVFCFSPERYIEITVDDVSSLQCFLKCFSIQELTLKRCSFSEDAIAPLSELIRNSDSVTSFDFSFIKTSKSSSLYYSDSDYSDGFHSDYYRLSYNQLSDADFSKLFNAFQAKTNLNKVNLSSNSLSLNSLLTIFELISSTKLTPNVEVSPHFLDFSLEYICYQNEVDNSDLISLLKCLKSNISVKRVECLGFKRPISMSLEGLMALFQIQLLKKSVIDLDISPHCISVDDSVFVFHLEVPPKFLLKNYIGSSVASQNFTSSSHKLNSEDFSKLLNALQYNIHLKKVNLSNKSIGFNSLLTIFELISTDKLTSNVEVLPHYIDFSLGLIGYQNKLKNDDLFSLLNALKSNVPIKRVESHGLSSPGLKELNSVYEVFLINSSVIDFDLSDDSLNAERLVFVFPQRTTQIATEFSSLQFFFKVLQC
ncbi:hypothetical protein GEMRC1_009762 [Eukaryota sp. GEM-RC1]